MLEPLATEAAGHPRATRPRALIVTIYGLYAREVGGWLSVGALIRLMATVGVEEPAVRSSISRLKRRGILVAERVQGVAGYGLSLEARTILRRGDRRIFERPRARVDDGWVIAVFSVPEVERDKRHRLRSRLSWLGFGTVSAAVWIAPAHVEAEAREMLLENGLSGYVNLFRAEYVAFGAERDQVAAWWDLEGIERTYADFVTAYEPVLTRTRRRRSQDDATAFAAYIQVLTHWRRLPYLDPGLPRELLPRRWSGTRAADLFFELRERLESAAHRHAETLTAGSRTLEPGRARGASRDVSSP